MRISSHNCLGSHNCLADVRKDLVKEWHSTKNGILTPYDVTPNSHKNVWWECENGHEWIANINNRNSKNSKCPYCQHRKISRELSLAMVNPKLSMEWHSTKNGKLTPYDVFPYSKKKVWWRCDNGHEWIADIYNRNAGNRCPYCFKRRVSRDRCLAVKNPNLAKEWNFAKNKTLTPYDVDYAGAKKVWWKCKKCGYEWVAIVNDRRRGNNCPCCNGIKLRNGVFCQSIIEAYYYIMFSKKKIRFLYNKKYGGNKKFKNRRYDFYLPEENKYIEVTSYDKGWKHWKMYYKKIVEKRKYVENILNANFVFISRQLLHDEIELVIKYLT